MDFVLCYIDPHFHFGKFSSFGFLQSMKLASIFFGTFILSVAIGVIAKEEVQSISDEFKDSELIPFSYDKCTAIVVGKAASQTGSPMTTHTADCAECDWRVNKVPARDWPAGSMRPIYLLTGSYPRQVREDRGYTWSKANLERDMPQLKNWENMENATIIGYIPQVPHTYELIEGMYGIMNEHGVAMGESTCAARLTAKPVSAGGFALLEVSELSQIALERSKTAREAILTMGQLAEQYGYYSAEWEESPFGEGFLLGEGGEALTVSTFPIIEIIVSINHYYLASIILFLLLTISTQLLFLYHY
jgi:hypothetical protein